MANPKTLSSSMTNFVKGRLDLKLLLASLLVFSLIPQLDLWVSWLFYKPDVGFHWRNYVVVDTVHAIFADIHFIILFLLLILLFIHRIPYLNEFSHRINSTKIKFLIITLVLGPGILVNVVLKDNSTGRARPDDVQQFDGSHSFTPFYKVANQCEKNCSFVSGHAAMGFYFVAFAWVFHSRRVLRYGIVLGAFVGFGRIIQGGHFLSDIIFAFWVTYFTAMLVARWYKLPLDRPLEALNGDAFRAGLNDNQLPLVSENNEPAIMTQTKEQSTIVTTRASERPELLSVVAPAFNEEEVLEAFEERISQVMQELQQPYELVFVNDGSQDSTLARMYSLRERNPNITIINLSRNFGKEIALSAGLEHAAGDAVVVIDTDLQDPPELIGGMIEKWRQGYDVVYGQRTSRQGESWLKKQTAAAFYRLMQKIGPVQIPKDTGDFRLMSRRVVESISQFKEHHRFMKGIFTWVGYPQTSIMYERDPRAAGATKWNYWKLWNFSLEGITSFTTFPLRFTTYIGMLVAVLAFLFGFWIVLKTLAFGEEVQGFPTIMTTVLFLGGVQLIAIGVVGEYLGRIFNETKDRPLYLIERIDVAESLKNRDEE